VAAGAARQAPQLPFVLPGTPAAASSQLASVAAAPAVAVAAGGSSRVWAASSSPRPVPWDDPFMWRRLLWQLLGKLNPQHRPSTATVARCAHTEQLNQSEGMLSCSSAHIQLGASAPGPGRALPFSFVNHVGLEGSSSSTGRLSP